jgi:hypothetical protein
MEMGALAAAMATGSPSSRVEWEEMGGGGSTGVTEIRSEGR